MVPLTIGLGILVAVMHTMWVRTDKPEWLRMTRFWGRIYLINFVLGVATGLVQEFQFGLAWSEYSRFVGDVFGSLLALEALLAFFLESTFLGLWIFGWGRIPKKVHLAALWAAVIGSIVSAYFIIAANSWMQHPVGVVVDDATGRPLPGRLPRRPDQQHRAGRVQPRDRRRAHGRRRAAGRHRPVAPAQAEAGRAPRPTDVDHAGLAPLGAAGRLGVAGRLRRSSRSPATGRASSCTSSSR